MDSRINISSHTHWEKIVGYSRAVRIGSIVEVAGTTAVDNGEIVSPNNPASQTHFILNKIKTVLEKAGCGLEDVVRTRTYVTDIEQWETIGKVHGEFFREIRPAATMVEVSALIRPELVVEIEVTAIINE